MSLEPPESRPRFFEAREEGVAVRVDLGEKGIAFAACSGGDRRAADRAIALASRTRPRARPQGDLWAPGSGGVRFDLERGSTLPTREDLERWLERATVDFSRSSSLGRGHVLGPAWVEAGFTVETLVADGGLMAFRSRRRVWGLAMVRRARADGAPERPRIVAARSLGELPVDGWTGTSYLGRARGTTRSRGDPAANLVVASDAAATLVASLAMTVHGLHALPGSAVGRAWRLRDDPRWPKGLSGGRFDDAGFPTHSRILADGSRVVGILGTAGHLRRPSFRDFPEPMFSTLVMEGGDDPMPSEGMMAGALRVHRIRSDRWVLDLEGSRLERGLSRAGPARFRLAIRPHDLVSRCGRAVGPARLYANGVATPTLVFEDVGRA